ncbi:hypothetical protein ACFYZJ_13885 [Streptomyces sp. NPDC001848]|uniref:hypothetical protein n=1 Tax=Streptomyces sp. NPDC001848 TaxID=3364618 RepID=UPI00369DB91E
MSWPSVVLVVPATERDTFGARLRSLGTVEDPATRAEVLHRHGYSHSLDLSGRVLEDFEPEEPAEVTKAVGEPYGVYLACQSMEAARALLPEVLAGRSGLIDLNQGDVLEFQAFLRLLERLPAWDRCRTPVADVEG